MVGGVGAGLLAVSIGQTVLGRTAFRANFLPLLLSLCLALLWWGWEQRFRRGGSWWRVALAGACAGLLPYTYTPAHFTPLLFLLFGLSFALPFGRGEDGGENNKKDSHSPLFSLRISRFKLGGLSGTFCGLASLWAWPGWWPRRFSSFLLCIPTISFLAGSQLSVFQPGRSLADSLATFLDNVKGHLLAFGFTGDPIWRHNFAGQPMLNIYEAFFFWLGSGMAVWRWQRPAYRLLLLWLGVMLLPATLARDIVPHTLRMIGAAPAVYLLAAVGIWEAFRFLWARRRALPWRASRIFQENSTRAAIAVGVVVGGSVLGQGALTYHTYFQKWANTPDIRWAYGTEWTNLAQTLNAQPSNADSIYLIPSDYWHYSFEYLYQGTAPAYMIDVSMPNLARKIKTMLTAMETYPR